MAAPEKIGPALSAALEGLKLARRELDHVGQDAERWRWVAVGLITALNCAAVAALSGYETAAADDTTDLKATGKVAPLGLLLRRARSGRFLVPPEQLPVTSSQVDAALRLADYRNEVVHGVIANQPDSLIRDTRIAAEIVAHFLRDAPAFDPAPHSVYCALIADELSAITQRLAALG
jgi:hypothetical protein